MLDDDSRVGDDLGAQQLSGLGEVQYGKSGGVEEPEVSIRQAQAVGGRAVQIPDV
nr:hypothetical protein [Streptomyces kaniharaensis]